MSDPSGFMTSPPSTYVKVVNTARDDMNGQFGLIIGWNNEHRDAFMIFGFKISPCC